jgi:ankyrin repeat protein
MMTIGSMCTPLMVAAHNGDMEAMVMLLEAKPDVAIKSSYGPSHHFLHLLQFTNNFSPVRAKQQPT